MTVANGSTPSESLTFKYGNRTGVTRNRFLHVINPDNVQGSPATNKQSVKREPGIHRDQIAVSLFRKNSLLASRWEQKMVVVVMLIRMEQKTPRPQSGQWW